jgi:hypothetical protein
MFLMERVNSVFLPVACLAFFLALKDADSISPRNARGILTDYKVSYLKIDQSSDLFLFVLVKNCKRATVSLVYIISYITLDYDVAFADHSSRAV